MGRSQQRKGRSGELELCRLLNAQGYAVRPGQAVSYGQEPDLVGLPGVHIEVKRREVVDLAAALKQAAEDAERFGDGIPAVFARGNRQKWRVTMLLDDWLNLYQRYLRK
ncbi:MAG: hypothetical protein IKM84_05960 [Oscillospiraceae bacterium]|nr:hypothetical protein [Oscillospiraceae bacterium]